MADGIMLILDFTAYFFDHLHHFIPFFGIVRARAADAGLDTIFKISEVSAALISKEVQGAIAHETVEIFFREAFVAGKVGTGGVLEK